jgi:hypothetical protein
VPAGQSVTVGGREAVKIVGLRETQKALQELQGTGKALREVNLGVAEMVAERARELARSQGGVIAKAADAIKAGAEQTRAFVKITANARFPFALGAEFGAGRDLPRRRTSGTYVGYRQFEPWRGNKQDAGYALYPTIRRNNTAIVNAYDERIGQLLEHAFPG